MLLAVDAGNTNIHLGLYQGDSLLSQWRISTVRERTGDELTAIVDGLFRSDGLERAGISGVAISNVVPPLTPTLRAFARRFAGRQALFVGADLDPGIPIRYTPPSAVGADRLADAVAVIRLYGVPAIVVDFGTATTFDAISRDGEYLGGAIAAGVGLSMEALFQQAAHLPRIELKRPEHVIGGGTVESMQSGAYYGFVGQVEGIVRRFRAELGTDTQVIATGGLAELIAPETSTIDQIAPTLTLEGIRLLWASHPSVHR